MKKRFILLVNSLLIILLVGCMGRELDYTNDELLYEKESATLLVQDGLLRTELMDEGYKYGIYRSDLIEEEDSSYQFSRIFFTDYTYLKTVAYLLGAIHWEFEDIEDCFETPDMIHSIIYNADTQILAILPDDTEFRTKNTVLIDLNLYIEEYNVTNQADIDLTKFDKMDGINIRDFVVSQLNIEYSEDSIQSLSVTIHAMNGFVDEEIIYYDIVTEYSDESTATSFYHVYKERVYTGTADRYYDVDPIPITVSYIYNDATNDHVYPSGSVLERPDDVLLSSELEMYIQFYK